MEMEMSTPCTHCGEIFDLNGLIEKGLAVDINTLNQEK